MHKPTIKAYQQKLSSQRNMEGGLRTHGHFSQTSEPNKPLFSIITIVYNRAQLLEQTIQSVLCQTYANLEYIIVDGGSTDETLDVIRKYENQIAYWMSEPDDGISDAMNKGVALATGNIIAHLHAGDRYIDSSSIERVADSYKTAGWRWGVARSIVVDMEGNQTYLFKPEPDYRMFLKKNFIPHQSTFLIREIFEEHGLFKTDYKQAMDYEFWLRITFIGDERYAVLPFDTTYFLEGGRSSGIFELLWYLYRIRKSIHNYGCNVTLFQDGLFLMRAFVWYIYYYVGKKNIRLLFKKRNPSL
jgi:glycosyltransferase involved in cell wall biosynthesis